MSGLACASVGILSATVALGTGLRGGDGAALMGAGIVLVPDLYLAPGDDHSI